MTTLIGADTVDEFLNNIMGEEKDNIEAEITEENRKAGNKALQSVNKITTKACIKFENKIKDSSTEAEEYFWKIYQVTGMLLWSNNPQEIYENIKQGFVGWKNPLYNDIALKIDEFNQYLIKPFEIKEGVLTCPRPGCGSSKAWTVQRQTRSSDEPMTTFAMCVVCGKSWVYSG